MKFNEVFLLTDFSEHAKNACEYALDAFGIDVNYVLINSFEMRGSAATLINLEEIAHQESLAHLENESQRLKALYPALKIEIRSKSGSTVNVINTLLKNYETDFVVTGSKGISKLDEILIGSTASAIIRGVRKPILTVPLNAKFKKMDQIVFGSDLVNANKDENLQFVHTLREIFSAKVSAATVKTDKTDLSDKEKEMVQSLNNSDAVDEVSIIEDVDISKGLMDYCEKSSADLLIVVAKHTSFFKRFFHKSITNDLVNYDALPILVLEDN